MGDSSKTKNNSRSSSRGSNINTSALGNRNLSPRNDLDAQISASAGPVKSAKDACAWLEKKGWMLASEPYSKDKLAEILFSVAIAFKLLQDADMAVRSVAYLIREHAEEVLTSSIVDKVIDKITNRISEPVDKLNNSVTSTKGFLDATSKQRAIELLSLQDSIKQNNDLTKSLSESSEKLNQASSSNGLSNLV